MNNSKSNIDNQTFKFLQIIEEIKATNKLLKVEPKTNTGIAALIYPTDKTIFTKLKNGMRKKVPFDALVNLATHFKVDMNYLFYDGFEINYNPSALQGIAYGKQLGVDVSVEELKIMNKTQYNSLTLAMGMYKKMEEMMETIKESNTYIYNKKIANTLSEVSAPQPVKCS